MHEYPQRLVSIKVREKLPFDQVPSLCATITACEKELAESGRVVVRYSGTEPKIRILVEASESKLVDFWIAKLSQVVMDNLCDD